MIRDLTRSARWTQGDWIVYRKSKMSANPGTDRASAMVATPKGESYHYLVDKYWVIERTLPDGDIIVRTPGGKRHELRGDDPNVRRANLLDRFWHRDRFLEVEARIADARSSAATN